MQVRLNLWRNDSLAIQFIQRFGNLSETNPFGERVWEGLRRDFYSTYQHASTMTSGRLFFGWFRMPEHFGKNFAMQEVQSDEVLNLYPAIFEVWNTGDPRMACLRNILMQVKP